MSRLGRMTLFRRAALCLALIGIASRPAAAARLEVGPERTLKAPSAAAKIAKDGDTVMIDPGTYYDCAVWSANHLTIAGGDGAVVITDTACEGKALFVIRGNDTAIRNISFARARVPDGNGAGIRLEGSDLTVADSKFIDNQSGILATGRPDSAITISNSDFIGNGACQSGCAHALSVGGVRSLQVTHSRFTGTKRAHDIVSAALRTELIDNVIEDGGDGTSSYLVDLPNGGAIRLDRNTLQKGPLTSNPRTAIMVGDGGDLWSDCEVVAVGNRFTNDTGHNVSFMTNWSGATPVLQENQFFGMVTPVSASGVWLHSAKVAAGRIKTGLHRIAGGVFHAVKALGSL